jgi:hypothetical protein
MDAEIEAARQLVSNLKRELRANGHMIEGDTSPRGVKRSADNSADADMQHGYGYANEPRPILTNRRIRDAAFGAFVFGVGAVAIQMVKSYLFG